MSLNGSSSDYFLDSFVQAPVLLFGAWEEQVVLGALLFLALALGLALGVLLWRGWTVWRAETSGLTGIECGMRLQKA